MNRRWLVTVYGLTIRGFELAYYVYAPDRDAAEREGRARAARRRKEEGLEPREPSRVTVHYV